MVIQILIFFTIFFAAGDARPVAVRTSELERHPAKPKNIFILAGQSNMAGRGGVNTLVPNQTWDGYVPLQCKPNPSILRLNAHLDWVQAIEPLHKDIDINNTNGIGPGMSFAHTLLTKDPSIGVIGLVPCAVGGTSITQWSKGGFLYNQLLIRTAAALRGGGGSVVKAILWYQGEADTIYLQDALHYKTRLEKFFTDVRTDLGIHHLLVIQVGLASGQGTYVEEVRKAQFSVKAGNIRTVDAMGLLLAPDHTHLSTIAEIQLGTMLANAFIQTQSP